MCNSALIRIPVDLKFAISDKVQPIKNHWLEITCPNCGSVSGGGIDIGSPIFSGEDVSLFHCHNCFLTTEDYEEIPAYALECIENGHAVISKVPTFKGKIEHCFYQKQLGGCL
ncbi:hypothetical protein OCF84_21400 (plasmid) [Shewanella xiamenensis]|uniref:hypothetical protein n=1 Tax=Shewanella xiamenensis TaxID=332186 RepID=UPI0024ACCAB2|nr:hypothetical protein [Shewanella xiamenensis]WHF57815.1 hypothetical protein OCF84_21400 [Shewanella xiamenensis]